VEENVKEIGFSRSYFLDSSGEFSAKAGVPSESCPLAEASGKRLAKDES
jgi:hypothetical protein